MPYNIKNIIQQIQSLEPEQASLLHAEILVHMSAISVSTSAGQAVSIGHIKGQTTNVNYRALRTLILGLGVGQGQDLQRCEATIALIAALFDEDSSRSSLSSSSANSSSSQSSDALDFSSVSSVSSHSSSSDSSSSSSSDALNLSSASSQSESSSSGTSSASSASSSETSSSALTNDN